MAMAELRLVELSAATIVAVNNLSLKPGQEQFLAPVSYAIAGAVMNQARSYFPRYASIAARKESRSPSFSVTYS